MFCYVNKCYGLESKHFLVIGAWERRVFVQRGVGLDNYYLSCPHGFYEHHQD